MVMRSRLFIFSKILKNGDKNPLPDGQAADLIIVLKLSLDAEVNGKIWVLSTINYLFYHYNEGVQGQRASHLPILVTGAGF